MKIALLVPEFLSGMSFLQQPLDFLYIAKLLEQNGHDVKIVDARITHLSLDGIVRSIAECDLVMLSTTPYDQAQNYFVDYRYAYSVTTANYIKKNLPKMKLVVCGAHSTVRPDLVLKEMAVDILIRGEAISTFSLLIDALDQKISLDTVPNLIYKQKDAFIETKQDMLLWHPDIQDDLFPAYEKVEMGAYFGVHYINNIPLRRKNRAVIQASRGCSYSCSFCHNFFGRMVRKRSPESVVAEMEICEKYYGVQEIFFLDLTFTLDRSWVLAICEQLSKRHLHLELTVQTRADHLDSELLADMAKVGFKNIWLGVESFDQNVLTLANKQYKLDGLFTVIDLIRKVNINPHAFFMLGMPGETIQSLNSTLKAIYNFKIPYTRSIMTCTPRYGTAYYELAKKQYPHIEKHWFYLDSVKGLVANEMTPSILQEAKNILKNRNFIYENSCPQI